MGALHIAVETSHSVFCTLYVLMLSIDIRSIYCSPLGLAFALSLVIRLKLCAARRLKPACMAGGPRHHSSLLKSVWPASAQLLLAASVRCAQSSASIAWCLCLFTYLVEQQPDQAAACCESLFTGLALFFPFDILSCCESLYSNRRHNLCVSRQVGARATCHLKILLCSQHRRRVCVSDLARARLDSGALRLRV